MQCRGQFGNIVALSDIGEIAVIGKPGLPFLANLYSWFIPDHNFWNQIKLQELKFT